jgi:hypothetical protein
VSKSIDRKTKCNHPTNIHTTDLIPRGDRWMQFSCGAIDKTPKRGHHNTRVCPTCSAVCTNRIIRCLDCGIVFEAPTRSMSERCEEHRMIRRRTLARRINRLHYEERQAKQRALRKKRQAAHDGKEEKGNSIWHKPHEKPLEPCRSGLEAAAVPSYY